MEFIVIPNEQTPEIREITEPISEYIEKHKETLKTFLEFANTQENAVGLAANQCALDDNRFAIRAFAIRSMITREWSLVINPEIIECLGLKDIKVEGCLTWKDKVVVAERYRAVKVRWYDMDGQLHFGEFKGFVGQIWQHEINHLNGVHEDVREDFIEPKPIQPQRNELCPCGSGLKFKKCCLKYN